MAEVRSLVLTTDGTMKRVSAEDSQSTAGTLTTTSGNLVLSPAGDVEVAADKDLVLAAGTGGADLSAGSGAFKTSTGAVTISGSSVAIDSTGVDDTLTIGANSENIVIGADGKLVTFAGDVQIDGAQTVVGETTFQQNATFEGNTTFGSDPADGDTVSFANVSIIGNFAFDGAGYKISNLLDPTAGSQEAATAKYVEDGLDLKVAKAGDTMTGPLTIAGNNDLYIGESASPGGGIRIYGSFAQDLLINPSSGVKALQNHLFLDATQNIDTSFGGTVKIGSDSNTLAVDIGRAGSTLTVKANLSLDSVNKITNLANGADANDAVNKSQLDNAVNVGSTFVAVGDGSGIVGSNALTFNAVGELDISGTEPVLAVSRSDVGNAGAIIRPESVEFSVPAAVAAFALLKASDAVSPIPLKLDASELDVNSVKIVNVTDPADPQDAATKNYADGHLGGVAYTFPAADGAAGEVLKTDGAGSISWQADVSAPAGNDTEIQFNNGGAFGASANLTWDGSALDVTGDLSVSATLKADGELWIDAEAALPAAEAGYGKLAVKSDGDGVLFFVDSAGQAHYAMPDGLNSLGSVSGNVTLDFDPALPAYRTLAVGGALTFQTPSDNLAAGRGMSLRLDNSAGGSSTRSLTFPNDWTWLAGSKPVQIEAGKVGIVSLVAYGTADTDIVAAWSYSDSVSITGGGESGQVAYFDGTRTIKSEGGLAWDETNDRLNIGAADNSAHSANLRVGGSAHIGGEVFLDGNVDLGDAAADAITVNGAMSLASGASFDGTSGTVDLPAQFSIDGSAVSANVTAANLNTLTGGSDASSLHTHSGAGAVIVALDTAVNSLEAGDVVCADSVALQVKKADADASQASARVLGVVESAGKVMLAGLASAKFKSGLTVALGEPVYLSLDAGLLTNVAPNAGAISEVGIIVSTADYAGATKCIVALQVKAPIFLS